MTTQGSATTLTALAKLVEDFGWRERLQEMETRSAVSREIEETDSDLATQGILTWVYDTETKRFVDLTRWGTPRDKTAYAAWFKGARMISAADPSRTVAVANALVEHLIVVDGVRFRPDRPGVLFEEAGGLYVNAFRHYEREKASMSVKPWHEFLHAILETPAQAAWVDRWCAHMLQEPGVQQTVALLLSPVYEREDGSFGRTGMTGKSTLIDTIIEALGRGPAWALRYEDIAGGGFTTLIENRIFIGVNEARDGQTEHVLKRASQVSGYENIKAAISPGGQSHGGAKIKFGGEYDVVRYFSLMMASNHAVPFYLTPDDRRVSVLMTKPPSAKGKKMADRIIELRKNPAFLNALREHWFELSLVAYSPIEPLDTDHRHGLMMQSEDRYEEIANKLLAEMKGAYATRDQIRAFVRRGAPLEKMDSEMDLDRIVAAAMGLVIPTALKLKEGRRQHRIVRLPGRKEVARGVVRDAVVLNGAFDGYPLSPH